MAAAPKAVKKTSKSVDKWKLKKKYDVIAPDIFNNVQIGPIFANDDNAVIGRVVETTLSKLANSNQHHVKIMLKVIGVRGFQALTSVTEIELARAYVSSQANPGSEIIEDTINAKTSDGKGVRVKTLIFTHRKVHAEQKKALRNLAMEIVTTSAQRLDYDHFVQEIVFGKIGSQIFNKGKKVVPLGRVEIRKLELRAVKNE